MIASLITRHHGEYVLRIGAQPPHAKLFAGEATDDSEGWIGIERPAEDLDHFRQEITNTVDEVGGKAS
jgi:hypothetical protein